MTEFYFYEESNFSSFITLLIVPNQIVTIFLHNIQLLYFHETTNLSHVSQSFWKKKSAILCYRETVTQMDCDLHFQIRLFFQKMEVSNSISNYMSGCNRPWLVTHLCKHADLCQMKQAWIQDFQELQKQPNCLGGVIL